MAIRKIETLSFSALLMAVALSVMTDAHGQEDPFGGPVDPFSPNADPFGAGGDDPFGDTPAIPPDANDPFAEALRPDPADVARRRAEREREWQRRYQRELVQRASVLFNDIYLEPAIDDRLRLDAGLSLLHSQLNSEEASQADALDVFSQWAQSPWKRATDEESPAEMVERLTGKPAMYQDYVRGGCVVGVSIPHLRKNFEKDSDASWPFDWRVKEGFFVSLAQAFFTSLHADDPADVWKERIADDKKHAELYTVAYLGVLRGRAVESVNTGLISRYLGGAEGDAERLQRLAHALASVAAARDDVDDFARKRLGEKLLQEVQDAPQPVSEAMEALASIAEFWDRQTEVTPLMQTLLEYERPDLFAEFCYRAKIGRETRSRWYLRKTVNIRVHQRPALEVLTMLNEKVELPLWIDDSIAADAHRIDIDQSGQWIDLLRSVTSAAGLLIAPLDGNVLWIGPPERREQAKQRLQASRGKIPLADAHLAKELQSETVLDFVQTPAPDVCDYFQDLHGTQFIVPWTYGARRVPTITAKLHGLPLHLALTMTLEEVELTWAAAEGVIAVGPQEFVQQFEKAAADMRAKRLFRAEGKRRVATALDDLTTMEFIETPLEDVLAYTSDLHGVPALCVDQIVVDHPITKNLKGMPLDWGLSLVTFDQGLAWFADDDAIYVGSDNAIDTHRRLSQQRHTRRKKFEMLLGEKLQQPLRLEFIETPLKEVASILGEASGLRIELDDSSDAIESVPVTSESFHKLPVDVHLDLIASTLELTWELKNNGTILIRKLAASVRD